MRVAYDITMIGLGYVNTKFRTGIYRMVESLLFEFVKHLEIELETIAFNHRPNVWDDISISLYFQRIHPELKKYYQSYYQSRLNLMSLYKNAVDLQRLIIQASGENKPLLYKLGRGIQIPFNGLASLDIHLKLSSHNWNVYHSPYFPLPNSNIIHNTPRVLTVHDIIPGLFPEFAPKKVQRRFLATIKSLNYAHDWIICVSHHTKQDFCNYTGMNPERVFVTPIAAADFFHPVTESTVIKPILKRYGIPDNPYLLSLSILEPRKNLSFLIRCFYRIIADDPSLDVNLVLVGVGGWKSQEIFQTANQNPKLKSRLIFTGHVQDGDLSAIYSGAIAFVYPSLYEGFGLPPLEAMQCGTPVITSNTSSLPEVVGDAGILIDPKREDELCQALLKVLTDSQLRTTLSRQAIQQASKFTWAKCAEETIQVYKAATNS